MRTIRLLLDANVLVDAQVRGLFLRMAEAELIEPKWSAELLAETFRALVTDLGIASHRAERLIEVMRRAFPEAEVTGYDTERDALVLPDPDDRHVLAAAIVSECDVIVTENKRDFPYQVGNAHDLLVADIDDALRLIIDAAVVPAVEAQIAALRRPTMDLRQFLARLSRNAPVAAMRLGTLMDDEVFSRLESEAMDAEALTGPHEAVRRLLAWALGDEPEPPRMHSNCVRALDRDRHLTLDMRRQRVRELLSDVCDAPDEWGFATARRPQSPGIETVLLVRAGDQVRVAFDPHVHRGHTFHLEYSVSGWVLLAIDPKSSPRREP